MPLGLVLLFVSVSVPTPVLVSSNLLTLNSMSMLMSLIAIWSWGTGTLPGVPNPRSPSYLTSPIDWIWNISAKNWALDLPLLTTSSSYSLNSPQWQYHFSSCLGPKIWCHLWLLSVSHTSYLVHKQLLSATLWIYTQPFHDHFLASSSFLPRLHDYHCLNAM